MVVANKVADKIMVVDDDPGIRNLIERFLAKKNYQVDSASDGKSALEVFEKFNPDLVVLDLNLPDMNGYDLCEQMQSIRDVFVLMLTSRKDTADKIKGFTRGADDFVTKPFDILELEARVKAILGRRIDSDKAHNGKLLLFEDLNLEIDPVGREVKLAGDLLGLTALEFDLLYILASSPGKAWYRADLIAKVWQTEFVGDQRVVDVHIGQIRKKIEAKSAKSSFIKTVRGVGYKFQP